jgi:hypothetical protein
MMGGNGWAWAMDEYGRHPGDPQYKNKEQHELDWMLHELSKREWAKKRIGKALAQIDEFRHGPGNIGDTLMLEYLEGEGLLPKSAENESEAGAESTGTVNVAPSET